MSVSRTGEGGINIQVLSLAAGASKEEAQTVRVILRPIYSREQLIAELSQRDPAMVSRIADETTLLLKGKDSD